MQASLKYVFPDLKYLFPDLFHLILSFSFFLGGLYFCIVGDCTSLLVRSFSCFSPLFVSLFLKTEEGLPI